MTPSVRFEQDDNIAIIIIDNPPVNAGSLAVRQGLMACVEQVQADPTITGAVVIGAGKTFIAGSDLKEFGLPLQQPQLPDIIVAIEQSTKPFVAALHGAALGGGYELALGCDARVASLNTVVGLPEVTLGMIPGAGGTQRLPRLVGVTKAIPLIVNGTRVKADEAYAIGMIDAVASGDLRTFAVTYAKSLQGRKHLLRQAVPMPDATELDRIVQEALQAGHHRPHVRTAIDAIIAAATTPFDKALASERQAFQDLRVGTEASALRHLFFSEREALKLTELQAASPRTIQRIGIVGANDTGTHMTLAALGGGFEVILLEPDANVLQQGIQKIQDNYTTRIAAGALKKTDADAEQARFQTTTDSQQLAGSDLVIDTTHTDLSHKRDTLQHIESVTGPDTVVAVVVSALNINAITEASKRPHNVVGLQVFAHAKGTQPLEIIPGSQTSLDALATCFALGRRLGKLPLLANDADNAISQRLFAAFQRQYQTLLANGIHADQIKAALQEFGFSPDTPLVPANTTASREPSSLSPTSPGATQSDIQDQLILALVNEAARMAAEGAIARVSDIDLMMVHGFGFPKWEGGPIFWACRQEPEALNKKRQTWVNTQDDTRAADNLDLLRERFPKGRLPAH